MRDVTYEFTWLLAALMNFILVLIIKKIMVSNVYLYILKRISIYTVVVIASSVYDKFYDKIFDYRASDIVLIIAPIFILVFDLCRWAAKR